MAKKLEIEGNVSSTERIEPEAVELTKATLSGDMADILLNRIQQLKKPWDQLAKTEQLELVTNLRIDTTKIVTQAVQMIAGFDRHCVVVNVKKVSVKSGLEATITTHKNMQSLIDLGMAEGKHAMIIIADESQYIGESTAASSHVEEDQKPLFDGTDMGKEDSIYEHADEGNDNNYWKKNNRFKKKK